MQRIIKIFQQYQELDIVEMPLDIYLEIPHLAYIEAKKPRGGKALLFTNPIDKRNNKKFDIPVLMNIFGSEKRVELIMGRSLDSIQSEILNLLDFGPAKGFLDLKTKFQNFISLRHVFPRKRKWLSSPSQEVVLRGDEVDLYKFPILTTWENDKGPFITMGQVYTQSLDGTKKNLGMYRLQIFDKNHLGLHWQIHKDSQHFFHQYQEANQKMPVSIALGGDALYTWCGQAPLPQGLYELMLYGFIKKQNAIVKKCITNPLYVPYDADIVIEGWVDPNIFRDEGPFGDHTGFYTPIQPYPVLEVSAITHKKKPIFPATVVGKPPLEDKYMGHYTERIFLPLLQKTAYGLMDMYMPENGVFHNLILVRVDSKYPAHTKQLMHNLWGIGQMSFVKHVVLVGSDAPEFHNIEELSMYILNRFSVKNLLISEGVCDALDHSSPDFAFGGKLGIDVVQKEIKRDFELLDDDELLHQLSQVFPEIKKLKQYFVDSNSPICVIGVEKSKSIFTWLDQIDFLLKSLAIVVFVDAHKNDLNNLYMLIWRITNNIDAKRDVAIRKETLFIDATDKMIYDGHLREWPKETDCNVEVIKSLKQKGLLKGIDEKFLHYYQICNSPQEEIECLF
ncbi:MULTISPECIES: menaquinone biosynthesis decarboxylase [unclassified Helicobacter]|uniref:menaquinone biosynthesis decarboxylase n=1 Tax=unclassified Helicobacter TaxID=2593540 RepID=UPI000CF0A972|nr:MULTISPECIES: menaquinone biosynthesis decarboxylase [unclassified Helicobacter]